MPMHGLPQGVLTPPRHAPGAEDDDRLPDAPGRLGPAPGTIVLVAIFLLSFVVYYFTNWKLLSFVWKIG